MATSLYLSNNNILAVLGSGGKSIKVRKLCRTQIPEGSLINGIITNETELAQELSDFWSANALPKQNVSLVISSTQFTLKSLSLPTGSEKKIRETIPMEFENSDQLTDPIYDYMITRTKSGGNMTDVQAVMAERSFIKSYVDLFSSIGVSIDSINTGRGSMTKLMSSLKHLAGETCVIMYVDNTSIASMLWSDDAMIHSMQNRVFSDPGSEQFGTEIARIISNLTQFASTQHLEQEIEAIYLGGVSAEELETYRQSVSQLGIEIPLKPMEMGSLIKGTKNTSENVSDYMYCLGDMLRISKDINLVEQAKKKVKKKTAPVKWKRYAVWPLIFLLVFGGVFGFVTFRNRQKTKEIEELETYINDPDNIATNEAAQELETKLGRISTQLRQIQTVGENIDSYPLMNSSVVSKLEQYARAKNVSLEVESYDASEGTLGVDAEAADVTQINHFIDSLEDSGLFDDITYTGYTIDEETQIYTIHVTCYLAENAGK